MVQKFACDQFASKSWELFKREEKSFAVRGGFVWNSWTDNAEGKAEQRYMLI